MPEFSNLIIPLGGEVVFYHDILNFLDCWNLIILNLAYSFLKHVIILLNVTSHLHLELREESGIQPLSEFDKKLLLHGVLEILNDACCLGVGARDAILQLLALFRKLSKAVFYHLVVKLSYFRINSLNKVFNLSD
jgi:hypothetical protein